MFAPHIHTGKPRERLTRTLVKTIVYRVISGGKTAAVAYLLTGSMAIAGTFAVLEIVGDSVLYFLHERAWAHIDLRAERKAIAHATR